MTRNRASAAAAGTRFERLMADWLKVRLNNDNIDRRTRNGRLDRGDIGQVRAALGGRIVLELKDAARHDLSGWLEEAELEAANDDALVGVVVFKKRGTTDPAAQYVLMSTESLARLLTGGAPDDDEWGTDA